MSIATTHQTELQQGLVFVQWRLVSISPSNSVGVKVLINQQPTPFAAASYVLEQDESWRLRLWTYSLQLRIPL